MEEHEDTTDGCTCNNEYATTPCPIHFTPDDLKTAFENEPMLITDELLSKEVSGGIKGYGSYEGFKFMCPECGVYSIMVNPDMPGICLKCHKKVKVESATVTQFIRDLEKKMLLK